MVFPLFKRPKLKVSSEIQGNLLTVTPCKVKMNEKNHIVPKYNSTKYTLAFQKGMENTMREK